MKIKTTHLVLVVAIMLSSSVVWFKLRQRTQQNALAISKLQQEIQELHSGTIDLTREKSELERRIQADVDKVNDRLAALAVNKAELAEPGKTAATTLEAELPYRWNDESPTARVGKRFLRSMRVKPFAETDTGEYSVDTLTAAVLSMTPDELDSVNATTRRMVEDYRALEKQVVEISSTVTDPDFNWIENLNPDLLIGFHIPALSDAGEEIRARFVSDLNDTLGTARTTMFMELGEDQFRNHFGSFGQADRWLYVAERVEGNGSDIALNVFEKTSNGHYYNVGMGIPVELLGQSGPGIPVSWRHLIDGHYVQGQSLSDRGFIDP